MWDQKHEDVSLQVGHFRCHKLASRQFIQVWINHKHSPNPRSLQVLDDLERRAFSKVVDVRLIGRTKAGDDWINQGRRRVLYLVSDPPRLAVVNRPGSLQ